MIRDSVARVHVSRELQRSLRSLSRTCQPPFRVVTSSRFWKGGGSLSSKQFEGGGKSEHHRARCRVTQACSVEIHAGGDAARRPDGQCHRKSYRPRFGNEARVRVKRWGKSPPLQAQARRHGKPHRVQGQIGDHGAARSRFRESGTGSGYWLLRQMILSARKSADKIRLTALPKPFYYFGGDFGFRAEAGFSSFFNSSTAGALALPARSIAVTATTSGRVRPGPFRSRPRKNFRLPVAERFRLHHPPTHGIEFVPPGLQLSLRSDDALFTDDPGFVWRRRPARAKPEPVRAGIDVVPARNSARPVRM